MRTSLKTVLTASVLAVGLAAAPALQADPAADAAKGSVTPKEHGAMMDQGNTMRPDAMKAMTKLMSQMMAEHGKAMQSMMKDQGAMRPAMQPGQK